MSKAQKAKFLANLKPKLKIFYVVNQKPDGFLAKPVFTKKISCKYIFKYIIIAV